MSKFDCAPAIIILFKGDDIELKLIMQKFAASGWDLISVPAKQWLAVKRIRSL